jgi:hypothetical protein
MHNILDQKSKTADFIIKMHTVVGNGRPVGVHVFFFSADSFSFLGVGEEWG